VDKIKEIEASVAAMRLDIIVGAGFGCSRSKAAQLIKEGLIALEDNIKKDVAYKVNIGDIITYKGREQCKVEEVLGTTRSGRQKIRLVRFKAEGDEK